MATKKKSKKVTRKIVDPGPPVAQSAKAHMDAIVDLRRKVDDVSCAIDDLELCDTRKDWEGQFSTLEDELSMLTSDVEDLKHDVLEEK